MVYTEELPDGLVIKYDGVIYIGVGGNSNESSTLHQSFDRRTS